MFAYAESGENQINMYIILCFLFSKCFQDLKLVVESLFRVGVKILGCPERNNENMCSFCYLGFDISSNSWWF